MIVSMLNLTQGITTVETEHLFLIHQEALLSGDLCRRREKFQGSTQRPSALIRLINSSTPSASGTFLISSLPRYKEM
ncbi:hypothetical protein Cylst_4297 [Cylindrospermum stagnale PCC 7417]|uniref:Uncharacterized protein n=1 Tax=Cylindrospermum stagnale PCC 7417 TaxID=56107 RepID=K9X1N3_9NOST|nr:hypothetical protein Cylst_4297 [Cylindrospermum stagnale PCC 7417]